jgi:SdrD B-like domain
MNAKRNIGFLITISILLLLAAGARTAQTRNVAAEAPRLPPALSAAELPATDPASPASSSIPIIMTETFSGATVTQQFELHAGWNAIYLGVEPVNPSPVTNGVPEQSVMEAVFEDLAETGALESVWSYNQPVSLKDYIVDPSEGLWDAPGWERYVPEQMTDANRVSQGFLSNLFALHANTAYLVKLKDNASGALAVTVSGKPALDHHGWALGAFNLAGFPLLPSNGATVGTMKAASPITEVRELTTDGKWTALADGAALRYGQSYLVYYADPGANGKQDFAAPLDLQVVSADGLTFTAGSQGKRQTFDLENRTGNTATATLTATNATIALRRVDDSATPETSLPLTSENNTITLDPHGAKRVILEVNAVDQPAPGEALLDISSQALGIRWLVPMTAAPGSYDGLWAGEVLVNEVSEARLGSTNSSGDVTIALAQQNTSLTRGSAEMHEVVATGGGTTVAVTVTLSLPTVTPATMQPIEGTPGEYVGGYVFLDENQNGQRDADEPGLSGLVVTLGSNTQTTLADGSYLFSLTPGTYDISAPAPAGYTEAFKVTLPDGTVAVNSLPTRVTLAADGISGVEPSAYLAQVLPTGYSLPYYDVTGEQVEPQINFGYAIAHTVELRPGTCGSPGTGADLVTSDPAVFDGAVNGVMQATIADTLTNLLSTKYNIAVKRLGIVVACGDIVKSAPTKFANGEGSEFRFRLLLRVTKGVAELLPHYAFTNTVGGPAFPRLSSPALSIGDSVNASLPFAAGNEMKFLIDIAPNDPLNPFKHKYNPDHDNLDAKFQPFDPSQLSSYLWESFDVKRTIALTLTEDPSFTGLTTDEVQKLAAELDWGGLNWGGVYTEVLEGLHQNDITVKGYFVIRHSLPCDELLQQDYDAAAPVCN